MGYEKLGASWLRDKPELAQAYVDSIPVKRFGTRHDCAQAALFLGSNEAAGFVTGSTLVVDGGEWMTSAGMQ